MKLANIKLLIIVLFAVPVLFAVLVSGKPAGAVPLEDDEPTIYKTKCLMCHGPKAEKAFDLEMSEEEMVAAILDGKKAVKPPHMPAFKDKGIDAEKAKALVDYMRNLRNPPGE